MTDPLDGRDAARRAGRARSYDAEEVAAHMLFSLYLSGVLANDWQDVERRSRKMIERVARRR